MDVTRIRALRGPNLWTRRTAIEAVVRCTPDERAVARGGPLELRLRELFPALGALRAIGEDGDLPWARLLERLVLTLQAESGCPVAFSRTAPAPEAGVYLVVVEYTEEKVGRRALALGVDLLQAAATGGGFDLAAALAELRALDEDIRLSPSTGAIAAAALARGIPVRRLTEGSLVQLGWGAKQRRFWAAELDSTSAVSESIAQDKDLTKQLLLAAGVPVPTGLIADTADAAWAAAQQLGLPVVVKPRDGSQGKGVTVNIVSREHLDAAFPAVPTCPEFKRVLAPSGARGAAYHAASLPYTTATSGRENKIGRAPCRERV